jgi:RimJ/RimL family protein N-acetyltransferase
MSQHTNSIGQPIGFPLTWKACPAPPRADMLGRYCRLEPLDPDRHAAALYAANGEDREGRNWTYLPYGPFNTLDASLAWMRSTCLGEDPLMFALIDLAADEARGVAGYLRIQPELGSIEVGHIHYAPRLQKTRAATEAMFLMVRRAFDELGYRRYEWKCDSLNAGSRRAAERLGFRYEGLFRQAATYKDRNRDTAWYSVIDSEWPRLRAAFEAWLDPGNFDDAGRQKLSLSALTQLETSS